ncbi:hypothetical protein GCM10009092_20430 [Bowmanella denitrificans]|uniref:Uncharacterized protein n=2 Tax=Bowmanella denitrificans TaxID=366582 RepID=A0ABN0X653_9ALTE
MKNDANKVQKLKFTGTVKYKSFEGGFYAIDTADGGKYHPMGLSQEHRRDGLIVEVEAQTVPDLLTIQQYGTPIKILSIKVLDDSQISNKDNRM